MNADQLFRRINDRVRKQLDVSITAKAQHGAHFAMFAAGFWFAMFFSLSMTATGLSLSGYVPRNDLIADEFMAIAIAFLLQIVIASFYTTITQFVWRKTLVYAAFSIFGLSCIMFSASISLVAINVVEAPARLAYQREVAKEIDLQTRAISRNISSIYRQQLEALDGLAKRSEMGLDRSGRRGCKSICKGHLAKANALRNRFAPTLAQAPDFVAIDPGNPVAVDPAPNGYSFIS